jgi:hypothetical protein
VAFVKTNVSEEHIDSIIVTAKVVPIFLILFTLTMEAINSSNTSVLTRATQHQISEDGILQNHRRENLKSYIELTGWALKRRSNVSPVKYKLGFYNKEDDILHSRRRENLKSYEIIMVYMSTTSDILTGIST